MSRVRIVTDTLNCLPTDLIQEHDIRVLPMGLVINRTIYKDMVNITTEEFWRLFPEMKEFTTSAVSVGDFVQAFEELSRETDSILCATATSRLSAVYESAIQAKELLKTEKPGLKIEVIDTKMAAGAQGLLVLEAARAAKAGKSLGEVTEVMKALMPKVRLLIALETLKYLVKSGRAPKVAMIGEFLQVKPIVGMMGSGVVESVSRARTKPKALQKIVELIPQYADTTKPLHVIIHHSDGTVDAERVRGMITKKFQCTEVYLSPFTPVMCGCTGPVTAIAFYS